MTVIVCVDDNNGMMFNKRRVSSDAIVTQRILELTKESRLWVSEYSSRLLSAPNVQVDNDFPSLAQAGEFCFVEDVDIAPYAEQVERVILYRWNRRYPSDVKFTLPLSAWQLKQSQEFAGKSHADITEEVYER